MCAESRWRECNRIAHIIKNHDVCGTPLCDKAPSRKTVGATKPSRIPSTPHNGALYAADGLSASESVSVSILQRVVKVPPAVAAAAQGIAQAECMNAVL